MRNFLLYSILLLLLTQCTIKKYNPKFTFNPTQIPLAPDYSKAENWAALPQRDDIADKTPSLLIKNMQEEAQVDVFFLHPTTLLQSHKNGDVWNADINDQVLNKRTDEVPILYQATAFNGAGKVYAPRYRQAHYWSFVSPDKASSKQALDIAYADILSAFRYYMAHYNNGRPFMIASHSQGARHAIQLIKDEIEQTPVMNQLVVAYIAGWPVEVGRFKQIKPCERADQTGCYCSWRTFERNFGLKNANADSVLVTNPLNWSLGAGQYAPKDQNKGAVLKKFDKIYPGISDADTYRGVLLCTKPKFPGSFLLRSKNYHAGDINLYYMDIRENAILRSNTFLQQSKR